MIRILALTLFAATLGVAGCNRPVTTAPKPTKETKANPDKHEGHEHHEPGPHQGTVMDWGGGKYHVEFTVDHPKKQAVVYILGSDEVTATPIKTKDDQVLLTIEEPAFQVTLKADPQKGDPAGKASRFTGTHDKLGKEQEFAGTVSAEVDGTPYVGDFKEEEHHHKK